MAALQTSIRTAVIADAAGIARVHVDTWRTNYAGIVPDEYLQQLSYEKRELMWRSVIDQNEAGSHLLVALSDSEVIGFSSGGKTLDFDSTGELYAIYLRAQWQGTGLGRQLFRHSFQLLKNSGFSHVQLWALEDNPTCRFYRRMGGVEMVHKFGEFGDKKLKEILFTWTAAGMDSLIRGDE